MKCWLLISEPLVLIDSSQANLVLDICDLLLDSALQATLTCGQVVGSRGPERVSQVNDTRIWMTDISLYNPENFMQILNASE